MEKYQIKRLISLVLVVVMCLGLILPAGATETDDGTSVIVEKVDNSAVSADLTALEKVEQITEAPLYADSDTVRVSIVLSGKSTLDLALERGISTQTLSSNTAALQHRAELQSAQERMADRISAEVLGGRPLDVVWNLTLAANIISANVLYGQIAAIEHIPGVADVFVETRYEPAVVTRGEADPNMATSSAQIGSTTAYLAGYTGAGSRIAIIDTGTDTDHQSFDNDAFLYALKQNAADAGLSYDKYVAQLDLLDAEEIAGLLDQLNIGGLGYSASQMYSNEKLAFNFNYVDENLNVTHDYDYQGEHGSHVAGIATANRFIETATGVFKQALDTVMTQGVAPDAQLITMKVFGANGGAYDSDYMVAIEDAIILGADAINLSLGSSAAGLTMSSGYQEIMDKLAKTDSVVAISAGNNGSWADYHYYGYGQDNIPFLYSDDVNLHTGGSPGTYTNALTVASVDNAGDGTAFDEVQSGDAYYTMSYFSSWGVPGDLSLKPEITAPGGSIYSVWGSNAVNGGGSDQYEYMSGTSMAAPQVTGMMALLMQYIRENERSVDGLTDRALAQSLLMSTAIPLREAESDGQYYSVLKQGAGLANIGAAIQANSYILMGEGATDSAADGKVKAELGDDPDKTGAYEFSFTINNLTDEDQSYALSADFFTQDLFTYGGTTYLDTWTTELGAGVTWLVDGKEINMNAGLVNLDFDGDGNVDTDDGQTLLNYVVGAPTELYNLQFADLDGDSDIDSHDAYLFFSRLESGAVLVPASGSAEVTVQIRLTDGALANYPNGAYVEGYVYATGLSIVDGTWGEVHSIPVLGFYGNWTDASMYDEHNYVYGGDYYEPVKFRTNFSTVVRAGDSQPYYFGGNPYVSDSTYMPERNALNSQSGDKIEKYYFTSIRNAGNAMFLVSDAKTGEVYSSQELGSMHAAYFSMSKAAWQNTQQNLTLNWTGAGIAENTAVNLSLVLAPEYYAKADGTYDWDALGEGAYLTTTVTIDNTAPVLDEKSVVINEAAGTLTFRVTDNQYVAAAGLYDVYGLAYYTYEGSKADARAGDTVEYVLDISQVNGASFLLQVCDYAKNVTTYKITQKIGTVTNYVSSISVEPTSVTLAKGETATLTATVLPYNAKDRSYTWSTSDKKVATVDKNGVVTAVGEGTAYITATSKGKTSSGSTVSASCTVTVFDIGGELNAVVWDENGEVWFSEFDTAELPEYTKLTDTSCSVRIASLAYGGSTLYGASFSGGTSNLYKINTKTYEPTLIGGPGNDIFYADLSYAPNLLDGTLMAVYGPYILLVDSATGDYLGAWYWCSSDLVGIAYIGSSYDSYYGAYVDEFYLLDADGYVYREKFIEQNGKCYNFEGEDNALVGYSGISTDTPYYQSIYLADGYLYFSNYVASKDCVTIYVWDQLDTGSIYKLGQFDDNVWPVGGLIELSSGRSIVNTVESSSEDRLPENREENACVMGLAIEPQFVLSGQPVGGSLDSAVRNEAPARPTSGETSDGTTVILKLTAKDAAGKEVASTNGVEVVTYDVSTLTLESVVVHGDYEAVVRDDGEGTVTIGYVSLADGGIPAGEAVATLTFTLKKETAMEVSISHKETGNQKPNKSEQHCYDDVDFAWSEDIGGWVAVVTCDCGHALETAFTLVLDGSELRLTQTPDDLTIVIAGYAGSGKMTGSQVLSELTATTTLTITGDTIKVFFLDNRTHVPLTKFLTLK